MTGNSSSRYPLIDAWRGLAIALMVIFHFCFDLAYYRLAAFDFYRDPFWLHARTFILSQFLLLVGVGLVFATHRGLAWNRYLKRLGRVGAGAAAVTLATWWLFGDRFVFFGVLHFILVASILALPLARRPALAAVAGLAALLVGNLLSSSWFDQPGRRWLGLMTHKPATEDYVPLLPWIGVVLLGITLGHGLVRLGPRRLSRPRLESLGWMRALAFSGRHSLLIYLVHQPLLMGLLYPVATVFGGR